MNQLPAGWAMSTVGGIWAVRYGKGLPQADRGELQPFPYVGSGGVIATTHSPLVPGSVIVIGRKGTAGSVQLFDSGCWPSDTTFYLEVEKTRDGLLPRLVELQLVAARLGQFERSTALPGLGREALERQQVIIPPTAEQGRIVAAIEEAFSLLDAGETALHNTRTRLKRMRDAVLTAAVTGQLVPQDPTDTPASRLFDELEVEPVVASDDFLRVPGSWLWARVKDVGAVDLGRQRHPDWHTGPNMKPYLRVANVFEDRIDTSDVMEMHFEPEIFERFRVHVDDVLLNEGQSPELLGRPALYRGDPPEVAFTNSILRFRASPAVSPEWALLVFRAYMRTGRFTRESRITTNIAHLSAGRLKAIEFPVPPPEEQARIVAEVERQFSFIEAAERAVETGLRRSAGLRRSVLRAAFEGRLVAQDPGDEPASVLLERIAAERAAAAPRTRRAPRRVRGEAK